MGLFGKAPKRTTSEPSWGGPPPSGPVRFDASVVTAAELVGLPRAELPGPAPQAEIGQLPNAGDQATGAPVTQPAHIVAA